MLTKNRLSGEGTQSLVQILSRGASELGRWQSTAILTIFYIIFFAPIARMRRWSNYDAMKVNAEHDIESYRLVRDQPIEKQSMTRAY